jgi:hypothetical protein
MTRFSSLPSPTARKLTVRWPDGETDETLISFASGVRWLVCARSSFDPTKYDCSKCLVALSSSERDESEAWRVLMPVSAEVRMVTSP